MPNTTNGYPYPANTDPVAQGAAAIQSLATTTDTLNGRTAAGVVTFNGSGTTQQDITVTFPAGRFTAAPAVICTVDMGGLGVSQQFVVFPAQVTANGFIFRIRATTGSSVAGGVFTGYWFARTIG